MPNESDSGAKKVLTENDRRAVEALADRFTKLYDAEDQHSRAIWAIAVEAFQLQEAALTGSLPEQTRIEDALLAANEALRARSAVLRRAIARVIPAVERHGRLTRCQFTHSGKPDGWTCVDDQRTAQEDLDNVAAGRERVRGHTFTPAFGAEVASGARLCAGCRLDAVIAEEF